MCVCASHLTGSQPAVFVFCEIHVTVESVQLSVSQMLNVHKVELATGIIVALVVSFPGKVEPFRMAELVTWRKKSLKNEYC